MLKLKEVNSLKSESRAEEKRRLLHGARYLFEVFRQHSQTAGPLLPLDNPDASLQVLAGHAESVNATHLQERRQSNSSGAMLTLR